MQRIALFLFLSGILCWPAHLGAAEPAHVLRLWPGAAPGESGQMAPEADLTKPSDNLVGGKRLIRLGNVSEPTLSVFPAKKREGNAPAVLVIPGGGYHILAWDLEGTEVCDWLNSVGVTAVLLKYRVPKRAGLEKHAAPLQDAQRAMRLVRQNAAAWHIDAERLGVIGFSAGGHLAAALASSVATNSYPRVDDTDGMSCRVDFSMLIHPAYLTVKEQGDRVAPEVQVSSNHPPTFLAMTQDDPVRVETAVFYFLALKEAKVPAELHVYPTGGHGYGLRRTEHYVTTWPDRAADWMKSRGIITKK